MNNPQISIIVPVYNVERYLRKCMDSLINQTFGSIEIIAVNDGSADSSLTILQDFADIDKRVRIINQKNQGLSGARNAGIANAKGDYIVFVDGDDWIDVVTCDVAYQACLEEKADVVLWSYVREYEKCSLPKVIFTENRIFEGIECKKLHRRFAGLVEDELSNPENSDNLVTAWGKLYRADIIRNNKIQFVDLREIGTYEDGLFNLYYFGHINKAIFLNQYFNHYRKSNSSALTQTYKPMLFEHYKNLFRKIDEYITKNNLPDAYYDALNNKVCLTIIGLGLTECLKRNPKSFFERISFLNHVINDDVYKIAYRKLSLRYFPLHWKLFFACAKYNFSTGLYLLLLVIQKIITR